MQITQEELTAVLHKLGAETTSHRTEYNKTYEKMLLAGQRHDPKMDMRKGICLHAEFPNGWILSMQGSMGNYCEPRGYCEAYESLEIAVWPRPGGMVPFREVWEQYIAIVDLHGIGVVRHLVNRDELKSAFDGDSVAGWVDIKTILAIARVLISLPDCPIPVGGNMERDNGPWKM